MSAYPRHLKLDSTVRDRRRGRWANLSDPSAKLAAMGMNNKQRRAAKAKAKARATRRTAADHHSSEFTDGAHPDRLRVGAASLALRELVRHAAAGRTARFPRARVHPGWSAQLGGVRAGTDSRDWARREGVSWPEAREELIGLLALLYRLPVIEAVLPVPGSSAVGALAAQVDERVLQKVRALLRKAESTEFEHEAEALTAKAQHLMSTHSIERSLAEADAPRRAEPVVRRIGIDAPYVDGKAMLANEVAESNRSRCVLTKRFGFVTLVGFAADLDTVELLTTSLLVQATRAMTASGSHTTRSGTSRTRSFRLSFLVAYSARIGERLRAAAGATEAQADAEHDGRLLPVLAAHDDAVGQTMDRLFPDLEHRSVRVGDAAGWGAGRAAADLAQFDLREALAG